MKTKIKYTIAYQTGAYGQTFSNFEKAVAALKKCQMRSRKSGDCQGVGIEATEFKNGEIYGRAELTPSQIEVLANI